MRMKDLLFSCSAIVKSIVFIVFPLCIVSLAQAPGRNLEREKPPSQSEKRIALVIGNGTYKNAPVLKNPPNDARDMATTLKSLDFDVTSGIDLGQREMKSLIRDFGQKLKAGVPGLFYFAGHGVQSKGRNYLIPIDADIQSETDVEDLSVDVNLVLGLMDEAGNGLNIVILDACRNNPFARSFRSAANGLAQMSAPTGTLIAYATAPGSVARDGDGQNGVYTSELLKQMKEPGVPVEIVFKRVGTQVSAATRGQQEPWIALSLRGDFYFKKSEAMAAVTNNQTTEPVITVTPKPTPLPTPTPVPVARTLDAEETYWTEISRRDTRSGYESYLAEYPAGKYAVEGKNKIDKFKQDELARLKNIERAKWRDAQDLDTKEGYNAYLTAYPNGEFATAARSGIKALENKEERAKWREAQGADTKAAYSDYLSAYPNGEFVTDARSAITALENKEEQAKWDEVQVLNRKSAFQSYLWVYPGGKYVVEARQKIADFEAEEAIKLREQQKATELAKWEEAERLKTIDAYDGYLTNYPNGAYASLARLRLSSMGVTRTPVEETDWQEISRLSTRADYERYLSKYPEGKYASSAIRKIEETDWQEISRLGTRADYQRYLSKYPEGKYASSAKQKIKEFEDERARTLLAPIENDFAKSRYANVIQAAFPLLESISDKRGRINFLIGMSYYNLGEFAKSEPFLSNAIALGETVILKVKIYLPGAGSVGNVQNALPPGELTLQKDFLEFKTWAYWDFRVPVNKIYELKYADPTYQFSIPNPQIVLKIGIPKSNGKEEKRSYNFQPIRTTMTSCQGYRWCARCPDCQDEAKAIYRLIYGLKP